MSRRNLVGIYTDEFTDIKKKYKVGPIVGSGSYGTVRKVKDRKTGECFACKTIRKSQVNDVEPIRREIAILSGMDHPNIVKFINVYEDKKYIHLVQELCTGGELYNRVAEKIESGKYFSEKSAIYLLRDILDAVRYCHDVKHIVHRDLKPENFLLKDDSDEKPIIKIIDFGLSRKNDTRTGLMASKVGTPSYIAPEILYQDYTYKVDIWSIGVITYILLCGYAPFAGYDDHETLRLVQSANLEFGSPEWDDISSEAKDFVSQLLSRDPNRRPTATEAMNHPWLTKHGNNTSDSTFGPFKKRDLSSSGGDYPPLRMDSEKSNAFQKYLAMSKIKKSLSAVSAIATPTEIDYLGKVFQKADKRVFENKSIEDIDKAIETGVLSDIVKSNLQKMCSVMKSGTGRHLSMEFAPFLQGAIKNGEEKEKMSSGIKIIPHV